MCCSLDQIPGRLVINSVGVEKNKMHLRGTIDHSPNSLADRLLLIFQRLELFEKIAEIADESFHLFGSLLQSIASAAIYQTCRNLHHAAHDIEHVLHSFCFLGDLSRIFTGRYLEYSEDKKNHELKLNVLRLQRASATRSHTFWHPFIFWLIYKLLSRNV